MSIGTANRADVDELRIFRALSNSTRLDILNWLKHPEEHFPPHKEVEGFKHGVCVAFIQEKSGLSQSATSQYMSLLYQAGLVIPTRIGKYTYYRRNEEAVAAFASYTAQL